MKYLILIALFAFASAQEIETNRTFPIFDRPCSERSAIIRPNVKTAFNVAAYSGTWFEIGRYQQEDEAESDCMSSSYSWGFISRTFSIIRTGVDLAGNQTFTRNATALLSFPDVTPTLGLLNVTYYANREANEVNYYVLGTDYFQYALGWGCEDIEEGLSREYAWVLSRTPDLPENYRARVDAYIVRYLDPQFIRETNQDDDVCRGRHIV